MAMQYHELQHRALAKLPVAEQALILAFQESRAFDGFGIGGFNSRDPDSGLYQQIHRLPDEVRSSPEPYTTAVLAALGRQRDVADKFGLVDVRGYDKVDVDVDVLADYAESAAESYPRAVDSVARDELERAAADLKPLLARIPSERLRADVGALLADARDAPAGYLLAALASDEHPFDAAATVALMNASVGGDPLENVAQLERVERLIGLANYELKLGLEQLTPGQGGESPELSQLD